jgi:hypothetical protein
VTSRFTYVSRGWLALLWAVAAMGCGDDPAPEMSLNVTGVKDCAGICELSRVDVFVLAPRGSSSYCVAAKRSFAPSGARTIEGLPLEQQTTFRMVLLGYCGLECFCEFDGAVVVDSQGPTMTIPLKRASCKKPDYAACADLR